ncbi:Protease-associated domain, PA [Kalmanozyma brasiliensis GHG001]|uniref:Peptide hydrolase n=1 Tax=Kalmanozyma brasiliensis (strain GHG001) TaxID=1365824 RepID=V5EX23_KALBG|nr:Protease-associated domain, PA [Kalmanozyma brasiliensis GHG001]EST06929.1 Protease-associated domain, PA [Kalmanozyma brasiliensis GHG001]
MLTPTLLPLATVALALLSTSQEAYARPGKLRPVESKRLRDDIKRHDLLSGARKLQSLAYASSERNRVFGSPGHKATVEYIRDELTKGGRKDYYDVYLQPFTATYAQHSAELAIDNQPTKAATFTYSPNGAFEDVEIVNVANVGCDQADYPASVEGKIALVKRGTCPFATKVGRAGTAKAAAVIIYNNADGDVAGTLGSKGPSPEGPFVPVVGVTQDIGTALATRLASGERVTADLTAEGVVEDRLTHNVIAETKGGNKEQVIMVGAHSDSVVAGPGINDNGSGSVALLTLAKELSKYSTPNAVRFAWWSAEEFGLLGAEHYVEQLSQAQKDQIRLYLNFDMIASPNYVFSVHDGDGSTFNDPGPAGSAEAEKMFVDYFRDVAKKPLVEGPFDGRSDYGPFLDAGIAAGGLDTGAEQLKTEEEARMFGGTAGIAYDPNYHQVGDTVDNLAMEAFEVNAKAIAHAVATYATSFDSLGKRGLSRPEKRALAAKKVDHSTHRCGGDLALI